MQRAMLILQLVTAALLVCSYSAASVEGSDALGSLPHIPFYHRFSPQLKEKAQIEGAFPAPSSEDYHKWIVRRDLARHGRKLAATPSSLTFASGNITTDFSDGLHYAILDIGTPAVTFFVALDTGSDLFWLPCECKACAPASSPAYQGLPSLNVYSPSKSNTSKSVPCSSSDCSADFSLCKQENTPSTGQCSYEAVYGSPNTSTSGIVFQDVIHLVNNKGAAKNVTSPVVIGCGQTQTGALVDGSGVPDGLLGLGPEPYSVPSVLAQSGIVGDSFSVCFSTDGTGRVVFGDYGSSNITTTPMEDPKQDTAHYLIGIEAVSVGNESISVKETSLFDTGTSVTYLTTAVYKAVLKSFESQTTGYTKVVFDGVFDLCYATDNPNVDVPVIAFDLAGNATFPIIGAFELYVYANGSLAGFCVGILDGGSDTNIFGVNYMLGYNLIFNREQLVIGFEQSDCYSEVTSATSFGPSKSPSLSPSPSPHLAPAESKSPTSTPGSTIPLPLGVSPSSTHPPPPPGGSAAPRISVSLLSLLSLGLFANFILY